MFIRNIRKSDYKAVDNLLLQLHQQDVTSRPDLFSPTDHYMTKESFDNLVESRHVMTILAQQRMEILVEQNRCAMACQGCGAAFFFSIIK